MLRQLGMLLAGLISLHFETAMFPVERALLIINVTSGTGCGEELAGRLTTDFRQALTGLASAHVKLVRDHAETRAVANGFIRESERPALVVAGGGGGTLRAVIEGICDSGTPTALPGKELVRVGALRMGSGNVLAIQFGVPQDPMDGLRGLMLNLKAGLTVPCCVMRCEVWNGSAHSEVHHAVSMGGLGQFGRTPSDLKRWHAKFPGFRKYVAQFLGIETLNGIEYTLALLIRSVYCMFVPDVAETIEINFKDHKQQLQLLSGVVMNFPIKQLPFKPRVRAEDEALSVYLLPLHGRFSPLLQLVAPTLLLPHARCITLEKNDTLEIGFVDRNCVEFFLDEDPVTTYRRLKLGVAGSIAFVPGPKYQQECSA
jgi:Diacylglycerol kinase catalytic domain